MILPMEPFKAILFDLDGTLLDTLQDLAEAMNYVLKARGLPTHPLERYRYFVGEGATVLVKKALPPELRDSQTISEVLKEYLDRYGSHWDLHTRPYPGIPEMLGRLQADHVVMTVLSNKVHDFTLQCTKKFLGKWKFARVYGERPEVPRKPDPGGAILIAEELNISPSDFMYLGDTPIDMKTAKGAGMFPIGVGWGFRPAEELIEAGAKVVLKHPLELFELDFCGLGSS